MVGARQLVGEAVVIVKLNSHADCSAEVARMKELSEYDGTNVHRFNENAQ